MKILSTEKLVAQMLKHAGKILATHFGKIGPVRTKDHPSSVVCATDLDSEKYLVSQLRTHFTHDSIISEEKGYFRGDSEFTWIIDPLDGTSNFVSRLPWFGVQMGRLRHGVPELAAIYVPFEEDYYFAKSS